MSGRVLWNQDILYDAKSNILLAKEQDIHRDYSGHHDTDSIAVIGKTGIRMFKQEGTNSVYESLGHRITDGYEYSLFVFKDDAALRLYWERIRS